MKTNYIKYSILIGLGTVLGVVISNIGNVFGAQNPGQGIEATEIITNEACIEYTTPSGTGIKCDDVVVNLKTGNTQHEYFIKKRQKTGSMTNFTDSQITVQSGEYITYKVDFGSITGTCNKGTIEDRLPSCVRYVSSSIVGVTSISLTTGDDLVKYTNFRLNSGTSGYILVTGQVISNGTKCKDVKQDVNTGAFKCIDSASDWIYSSVVAIRTGGGGGGGGSGSQVVFTKTGNKYEMHPGETGLVFTLKVENKGPNAITGVTIDDIRPDNNCIIYDGWSGSKWSKSNLYKWNYTGGNGRLRSGEYAILYLYAKIKNDPSCTGSYINTGKLTYYEGGEPHILYDDYPFIVVDAGPDYDVSIEKHVNKTIVSHGIDVRYTIIYTNIGTEPLTSYTIVDNRPKDDIKYNNYQSTIRIKEFTNNIDIDGTLKWEFNGPLAPNASGKIEIYGTVK